MDNLLNCQTFSLYGTWLTIKQKWQQETQHFLCDKAEIISNHYELGLNSNLCLLDYITWSTEIVSTVRDDPILFA